VHGHADLADRLPHCSALRPWTQPGSGDLRRVLQLGEGDDVRGYVARGSSVQQFSERPARPRRSRVRHARHRHRSRAPARRRLPRQSAEVDEVHLRRVRRAVGDDRSRSRLPLCGHPVRRVRGVELGHQELATHLDECSHGEGGTCYGDSGGPNFLGAGQTETNIVAGTTVAGDTPCKATNVDYRLDTPSARAFLGQFVTLP
jgi:hypothetical protein